MVSSERDGPGGRGEKDGGKSLVSMMFTVTVADDCSGEVPLSEHCVCGWVSECECMRVGRGWLDDGEGGSCYIPLYSIGVC